MKYSIKQWVVKHNREIIFFILIFFVSSISFGLGYLIAKETDRSPIIIEKHLE